VHIFRRAAPIVLVLLCAQKAQLPADQAQSVDPRFGLVEAHDAPQQANLLGASWERGRFHWALIQPNGPEEWNEAELSDAQLQEERNSGREVVGLLIGVPEWARDQNGLPRGLHLPPENVDNLWANFVRKIVTRYNGQINHWIIWNEPDVWDASHPGFTWPGSEADFVQLMKVSYLTAKKANPRSVIHLAALSHWWDASYGRELYFKRLLDVLVADPDAPKNNYYYDVATLHLYFNPTSIYEILDQYKQIQADHGLDKPFWLVETNAAPSSDPTRPVTIPTFRVSLAEQAAFMPQALTLAIAAQAERIAIYKLIDTPGDIAANPEPFGLLRSDESPRPAYKTAQVAIEQLSGVERIIWTHQGVASQAVAEYPNHIVKRILWSRIPSAQVVRIPAISDRAQVADMWGNFHEISPDHGTYTIILYGGECQQTTGDYCLIGGPPIYLIEESHDPMLLEALWLDTTSLENLPAKSSTVSRDSALLLGGAGLLGLVAALIGIYIRVLALQES